jgi:transposase
VLLYAFYPVRSERQLMEQIDCNLLFRWFVGLGIDDPALLLDADAAANCSKPCCATTKSNGSSATITSRSTARWKRGPA